MYIGTFGGGNHLLGWPMPEIQNHMVPCGNFLSSVKLSGPQKGPAENGHIEKRQEASKSVETSCDIFRQFPRRAKKSKIVKRCQKQMSTGTNFPVPCGGLLTTLHTEIGTIRIVSSSCVGSNEIGYEVDQWKKSRSHSITEARQHAKPDLGYHLERVTMWRMRELKGNK